MDELKNLMWWKTKEKLYERTVRAYKMKFVENLNNDILIILFVWGLNETHELESYIRKFEKVSTLYKCGSRIKPSVNSWIMGGNYLQYLQAPRRGEIPSLGHCKNLQASISYTNQWI